MWYIYLVYRKGKKLKEIYVVYGYFNKILDWVVVFNSNIM